MFDCAHVELKKKVWEMTRFGWNNVWITCLEDTISLNGIDTQLCPVPRPEEIPPISRIACTRPDGRVRIGDSGE